MQNRYPVIDFNLSDSENTPVLSSLDESLRQEAELKRDYGTISPQPRNTPLNQRLRLVDVVWKKLTYRVSVGRDIPEKTVLKDISGRVNAGQMCALMGSSGAGKTTLLNVLAGRVGPYEGDVFINNMPVDQNILHKVSSYVVQNEILPEFFTVREALLFYARLKLPRTTPEEDIVELVDGTISDLGLSKAADTCIGGSSLRGISGGEKRRVSIGIELLTSPSVIFLDEPTSGLDSSSSFSVMRILKKLANVGRTIIASIHQPRPDIFHMMDYVLLVCEGETFYFGPTYRCEQYLSTIGFTCPENINMADYLIDLTTPGAHIKGTKSVLSADDIWYLRRKYIKSKIQQDMNAFIEEPSKHSYISPLKLGDESRCTLWEQIKIICGRNLISMKRNPMEIQARTVAVIFQSLLAGLTFFNLSDSSVGIRARMGVLFYAVVGVILSTIVELIQVFPLERGLMEHERRGNVFSIEAYYISRMTTDRIPTILFPLIYTLILYPLADLRSGTNHVLRFIFILFLEYNIGQSFSLLVGSVVPSVAVGTILAPLLSVIFILFSGYLVVYSEMAASLRWITDISMVRWGFQALIINEFEDIEYPFTNSTTNFCAYRTGDEVIYQLEYEDQTFAECCVYLFVIFLVLASLVYMSLSIQDRQITKRTQA